MRAAIQRNDLIAMVHKPSIVRARFILTILRMAREAEAQDARRLLKSAASEYPMPDTPEHLAAYEAAAIQAIEALSTSLSSAEKVKGALWESATVAATDWSDAANETR